MQKSILLTIDVEDWFQVENFKPWIPFSTWPDRELRVEQNVHRLLDLFDSISVSAPQQATSIKHQATAVHTRSQKPATAVVNAPNDPNDLNDPNVPKVRATFFILGWIADRLPHMVREIHDRGHEVASHGLDHDLPTKLPENILLKDLIGSRKKLEDIIGAPVYGYRAPSFSIDDHILGLIQQAGYLYDSSYNSFSMHGRYGKIHLNGYDPDAWAVKIDAGFYEIPVSNVTILNRVFPLGGGGYFRLFPQAVFNAGVKRVLDKRGAFVFYMHPWEIDPGQPRVERANRWFKFRHYNNLQHTEDKLISLIQKFSNYRFVSCSSYLFYD